MTPASIQSQPEAAIQALIEDFVATSIHNDLDLSAREKIWDRPLVGYAAGDDPLFEAYVAHIGAFYLKPVDIYRRSFPDDAATAPGALTVISWILPASAATRAEQSRSRRRPSMRWARTRQRGEAFNEDLRRHVVDALAAAGVSAVAPMLAPFWQRISEGPYAPCSNWSERHAAHAAGLGTFGLCDGLITAVGKAVRVGSVVARLSLAPTPRPYRDHRAYCLFFSHGTCGRCIPRCPVDALSTDGHDKQKCMQYTEVGMKAVMQKRYGIDTYACGLCQADVPCMDHIPVAEEG
ncbi:MAG: epoxyqueuosine reductase [Desulfobacterales bacterium]|nr:epoxyqueuosine reductase [Desulfobacterales bacterium]